MAASASNVLAGNRVGGVKVDGVQVVGAQVAYVAANHADLVTSVGTADGTIADVTGSFSQSVLNNNFKDIADKVNAILAALKAHGLVAAS